MSIQVSWDDETQRILRWDYAEAWTWNDAMQAAETTRLLRNAVIHDLVVVILNMGEVQTIPRDSMRNMRRLLQALQPGDIVIMSGDGTAVGVITVFMRSIFPANANQLYTAESLTEARVMAQRFLGSGGGENKAPTRPKRQSAIETATDEHPTQPSRSDIIPPED